MDNHLGYERHQKGDLITDNSRNGIYTKKVQGEYGESTIEVPRDRNGEFEPVVIPKHENRGSSIDRLIISLYAKGMSVSDIEQEMHEISGFKLSTSSIPTLPIR